MNGKHAIVLAATFVLMLSLAAMPRPARASEKPVVVCTGEGARVYVRDGGTTYVLVLLGELAEPLCGKQV